MRLKRTYKLELDNWYIEPIIREEPFYVKIALQFFWTPLLVVEALLLARKGKVILSPCERHTKLDLNSSLKPMDEPIIGIQAFVSREQQKHLTNRPNYIIFKRKGRLSTSTSVISEFLISYPKICTILSMLFSQDILIRNAWIDKRYHDLGII
jgi:hypothetical protein